MDSHPIHEQARSTLQSQNINAFSNCFGYAFLEGQVWLNLNLEILNKIIAEDNYSEVDQFDNIDGIVIYMNKNQPIHACKFISADNIYSHKLGANTYMNFGTDDINLESINYEYDERKYLVKRIPK